MSTPTLVYSSLGADPDLAELVELFAAEMPDRIETLKRHYETANWEELRRTAHQIKGAAGSYGFHDLTMPAARLEADIKNRGPEERIAEDLSVLLELCRGIRAGVPA